MPYVPNATDPMEPLASQTVESAALEFRTLKTSVPVQIAAAVAAEAVLREDADDLLQGQINTLVVGGGTNGLTTSFGFQSPITITTSQAVAVGYNAFTPGPITIESGVTMTVAVGSTWSIV